MAAENEPENNRRISIPNIPTAAVRWYLAVFNALTLYLAVTNTLFAVARENAVGWQAIQYIATGELLKAGGVALIASPTIAEAIRMVLAGIWQERRLRKARQEGREEGRAEGVKEGEARANRRWAEWNQRREEAEAKGEVFTEPPPPEPNRRD